MRSTAFRAISGILSPPYWHNIFLVLLLAGLVADFIVGLDAVLNAISLLIVVVIGLTIFSVVMAGLGTVAWITIRDAIEAMSSDRQDGRPWMWRIPAYVGIAGIIIDGAAGAWHVYAQHILFSTAVERLPLSGIPVWLLLASYPLRWIEQASSGTSP
jgi:hypothetical protein